MDSLKGALNNFAGVGQQQQGQGQSSSGGLDGVLGGLGNKLNSAAGGGRESEKNEDILDKGRTVFLPFSLIMIVCHFLFLSVCGLTSGPSVTTTTGVDFVQEKFLHQGPQDSESAIEQAKDEQISDFVRDKYKSVTGSDFPIKDKETRLG